MIEAGEGSLVTRCRKGDIVGPRLRQPTGPDGRLSITGQAVGRIRGPSRIFLDLVRPEDSWPFVAVVV